MDDKNSLRVKAKNIRKSLDMTKVSADLVVKIRQSLLYQKAKHVMIFYPTKFEVNLLDLLSDDKEFYLPRVQEHDLLVCPYNKKSELKESSFHIFEPTSNPIKPELLDLVVVPALMADKNGYRLGYGGGFYDRFLKSFQENFKSIVAIPNELFVEKLSIDSFDIPVDVVLQAWKKGLDFKSLNK